MSLNSPPLEHSFQFPMLQSITNHPDKPRLYRLHPALQDLGGAALSAIAHEGTRGHGAHMLQALESLTTFLGGRAGDDDRAARAQALRYGRHLHRVTFGEHDPRGLQASTYGISLGEARPVGQLLLAYDVQFDGARKPVDTLDMVIDAAPNDPEVRMHYARLGAELGHDGECVVYAAVGAQLLDGTLRPDISSDISTLAAVAEKFEAFPATETSVLPPR